MVNDFAPIQHIHSGTDTPKVKTSNLEDDFEFFKTVSSIPTLTPKTSFERIVIYISGATYRLYVYETTNKVWRYSTLT